MKKLTAIDILEEAFDEGAFEREQVRDALEDGYYLTQCGYSDDDQEAIEEAHALVNSTRAEIMSAAREAITANAEEFCDEEIIEGRVLGAEIPVAYCDWGKVYDTIEFHSDYSDNKLEEGASPEEVQALVNRLIEDALAELETRLSQLGIN